jgi:hypothetical protein
MPDTVLTGEYRRARNEHARAVDALVPLLVQMAMESIAEVLPAAHELEVLGRINEDWIAILRIQRVLDENGRVLFDVALGHDERAVEDMIDEVGSGYLDPLLDLTGDDFMGAGKIHRELAES